MKKIKALLLACTMLIASLCASGVSAQERLIMTRDEEGNLEIMTEDAAGSSLDELLLTDENGTSTGLHAGEHGTVEYRFGYMERYGVYIITDGSDFQWDFLELKSGSPDDYMEWREIDREALGEKLGASQGYSEFAEGYEDWVDKYGSEARVFCLGFRNGQALKQFGQIPRVAELRHDCILESSYMLSEGTAEAYWNGTFSIRMQEEYNNTYVVDGVEYLTLPAEVSAFMDDWKAVYEEWSSAREAWLDSIDADSMTPAQLEVSRREAGVASDLEMMETAAQACRVLLEEQGDVLDSIRPDYSIRNYTEKIRPISVWEMVGDLDRDGTVTAADAAMLLEAAANYGIGNPSGGLDDDVVMDADVNADHDFNAEDAALLLAYVAEIGSGSDISLEEFIKNTYGN